MVCKSKDTSKGVYCYDEFYSPEDHYNYIKSILDPHDLINVKSISFIYWYNMSQKKELDYKKAIVKEIENKIKSFIDIAKQNPNLIFPDYNYSLIGYGKKILKFSKTKNYKAKQLKLEKNKFKFYCNHVLSYSAERYWIYNINRYFYNWKYLQKNSANLITASLYLISVKLSYGKNNIHNKKSGFNKSPAEFLKRQKFYQMIEESYFKRNPYFDSWD